MTKKEAIVNEKLLQFFNERAKEENCSISIIKECICNDWGFEGLRGYGIFNNGVGFDNVLCICRIDEMDIYNSDIEAAKQAARDGIKLIPYSEQPKCYPFKCYRFLDTDENRKHLKEACKAYKEA